MKHLSLIAILASSLLLTACGNSDDSGSNVTNANAIELGTAVKDVIKPANSTDNEDGVQELSWDDLVPAGFDPETIFAKYQDQIDAAPEGSEEERVLFDVVMNEFNSIGPNKSLNGKTVRIPGFVAPLDIEGEMVGDFLLVPFYGSCIHSPPPPANQTVMISPLKGKSISIDQTFGPVWVVGQLEADEIDTDLAKAGYQINNAKVEPYIPLSN